MSKQSDASRYSSQTRSLSTNHPRVPWRSTAGQTGKKKTPAEKVVQATKCEERKKTIADAVDAAQARVREQAEILQSELGGHSIEYYQQGLAQLARIAESEREPNRWNAFIKDEIEKANIGESCRCAICTVYIHLWIRSIQLELLENAPRYKSNNLPPGTKEKWAAMSQQERIEYTKPLIEKLNATREMRKLSTHNIPLSAFHDTRGNLASIEREVSMTVRASFAA